MELAEAGGDPGRDPGRNPWQCGNQLCRQLGGCRFAGKGAVENYSSSGVQCAEEKTFFTCTSSSALQGRSHDGMQTEPSAT